ncbi:hypothetical protein ACQP0C_38105 [Nocardia sp. CA-129566]|uniref:hypothetical protein n=1 Tax=Nocardia sp. CA-129566 TaxID=3239976 RepID=UPI003D979882
MRTRLRAGLFIGTLLLAPIAATAPASAIPLEPATPTTQTTPSDQATPIWQVCTTPTPDLTCYLITLSSSGSGR